MRLPLWLLVLTLAAASAGAQEGGDGDRAAGRVPYAYAHSGTGFFSIGGESTQVVRLPFAYRLRPVEEGHWGAKLKFPLSFGAHEFEIREGLGRPLKETVETVALGIGVEFEIPLRDNWQLEPYVEAGFGKRLSGSEEAFLYRGGVKSLWLMPRERMERRLGRHRPDPRRHRDLARGRDPRPADWRGRQPGGSGGHSAGRRPLQHDRARP